MPVSHTLATCAVVVPSTVASRPAAVRPPSVVGPAAHPDRRRGRIRRTCPQHRQVTSHVSTSAANPVAGLADQCQSASMNTFIPPDWITPADEPDDENYARKLSRRTKRRELIRVRRGLYLPIAAWNGLHPWERFAIRIDAVHRTAHSEPVFCQRSAAQLLGIPVIDIPAFVDTLVGQDGGGRSSADVRRHRADLSKVHTIRVGGLIATSKLQTVRDLAVALPFPDAVAAMDRALSRLPLRGERNGKALLKKQVEISMSLLPYMSQQRRVQRVLDFADRLSGSPGESMSRAHMMRLGFPLPELQHEVRDSAGRIGLHGFLLEGPWTDR